MTSIEDRLNSGFADENALEDFMTTPTDALITDLERLSGDIMVLGVGGKMGPTLARMAKRAAPRKRIIGVARFSEQGTRERLESQGVECISTDLLDREAIARLPQVENIIYMAGRKFGSTGAEHLTWAMNTVVPGFVADAFRTSRFVVFSTTCVYPFVPVNSGGALESTPAIPPPGDYSWSCVGRERIFEHYGRIHDTAGRLFRLHFAIDMRYGVLHDVAQNVIAGNAIDLAMGNTNVIWQGDANAQAIRSLLHVTQPMSPINCTGPETLSIRQLALEFGERFGREPKFAGIEASSGWLVNTSEAQRLFGNPSVPLGSLVRWTGDWIERGMRSLGKPTHYEQRDGRY